MSLTTPVVERNITATAGNKEKSRIYYILYIIISCSAVVFFFFYYCKTKFHTQPLVIESHSRTASEFSLHNIQPVGM